MNAPNDDCEVPRSQQVLEGTEDNVVARLGITYGVLRRLGFKEDRVSQCLNAINGVDLDEAFEWVNHLIAHTLMNSVSQYSVIPKLPRARVGSKFVTIFFFID
jgi:hypothetical protein